MICSFSRGWATIYDWDKEEWLYADTLESTKTERPCIRCGRMPTRDGHDACLGYLDGVKNACCGHGVIRGYVQSHPNLTPLV